VSSFGFTPEEFEFFTKINTPEKIQDFIDQLIYNFCEDDNYVCKSPRLVVRHRNAHCLEGALLAAAAFRVNGLPPLLIELEGLYDDYHYIFPFVSKGLIGAVAQSKYYTLKWRDPVYRSVRELVLSYFPVYTFFGELNLRKYTVPVNLKDFDDLNWMTSEKSLVEVGERFGRYRQISLFPKSIHIRLVPGELDSLMRQHKSLDDLL